MWLAQVHYEWKALVYRHKKDRPVLTAANIEQFIDLVCWSVYLPSEMLQNWVLKLTAEQKYILSKAKQSLCFFKLWFRPKIRFRPKPVYIWTGINKIKLELTTSTSLLSMVMQLAVCNWLAFSPTWTMVKESMAKQLRLKAMSSQTVTWYIDKHNH